MDIGGMYRQDAGMPAQNLQGYAGMVNPYIDRGHGQAVYSPTPSPWGSAIGGASLGAGLGRNIGNWIGNAFQGGGNTAVNPANYAPTFDPSGLVMGLYGS